MFRKNLALAFWLLVFSSASMAAGWSNFSTVTEVYPHTNGSVYVTFSEMQNLNNCEHSGHIRLLPTNAVREEIYSALLSALAAGQRVSYYSVSCDEYPVIAHIRVRN